MVHPNERVVREYIGALGSADFDRAIDLLAEDVVVRVPGRSPISGELHGRDAVREMFQRLMEAAGGPVVAEIHDLLAGDEHVVALLTRTIAGVEARAAVVYHVRDGRITDVWPHEQDQYALDEAIRGS
jgi:uncharacterized protein